MSFAALAWAAKQKTGGLATKAALMALANYSDEHGRSYPSTAAVAEFGEMDHKTATAALDRLAAGGFIEDTGDRTGRTKQVRVYRLSLESQPKAEAFQKRKPSVSSDKAPQKRGTDTIMEPVSTEASPPTRPRASKLSWPVPSSVDPEHWRDFLANRKSKRLGFTPTAHRGQLKALAALADDEWPPGRLVEHAAAHGWGGIHDPRQSETRNGHRTSHPPREDPIFAARRNLGHDDGTGLGYPPSPG